MLAKVPSVVPKRAVKSWRHYLNGLWSSGLRLEESLHLHWSERDGRLYVDMGFRVPMLRVPAEREKGNKDRPLPLAPEFCEFLLATPKAKRRGFVFNPLPRRPERSARFEALATGRIVGLIGEKAKVKVYTNTRTKRVKLASAHDLRRSFGTRWATRVMPTELQQLMRHGSTDTTLRYDVDRNAEQIAAKLWDGFGSAASNTLSNSATNQGDQDEELSSATPWPTRP